MSQAQNGEGCKLRFVDNTWLHRPLSVQGTFDIQAKGKQQPWSRNMAKRFLFMTFCWKFSHSRRSTLVCASTVWGKRLPWSRKVAVCIVVSVDNNVLGDAAFRQKRPGLCWRH